MKYFYLIPALIAVVLVAGCTSSPTTVNQTGSGNTFDVAITAAGFDPQTITINSGDTVRFTNQADATAWPASDPHPTHTDYPGFDAKQSLSKGQTYSFTFTRIGTWGYHNHLNPSMKGTIIVK